MRSFQFIHCLLLAGFFVIAACQNSKNDAIISVRPNGEMTVFGRPAADFGSLKAMLVDSLAQMAAIPQKIDINFEGEVGMGVRQEVETIAAEAIEAAKLLKKAPTLEQQAFRKQQGKDCDKDDDDDTRVDCAQVDLMYHVVTKGEKALQDAVAQWTIRYLASNLENTEVDSAKSANLNEAVKAFFKNHNDYKKQAGGPALAAGHFMARTGSEVVLNNGKYLTLAINGDAYFGGAHGSPSQALATFEAQTGKILAWEDLVTDKAAVQALAEKKVRETKADVFKDGFSFDDIFQFVLPANYGLTQEGIFLYYVPYEIMPYAYGATEVILTYEELGALCKIRL